MGRVNEVKTGEEHASNYETSSEGKHGGKAGECHIAG